MENRISQTLNKLFERHRIVFWYDTKHELRNEFEGVSLSDVVNLEIKNNEYNLKYRLLREEPKQKFLLYCEGAQPSDHENWLLDVQLAEGEFRADQVAIWLAEMELGFEFNELVRSHAEFFRAINRKDALQKSLKADDTSGVIRMKMLAVCVGSDSRMDAILESLLQELAEGGNKKFKLISRCNLVEFLWEQMDRSFGYNSDKPNIGDFLIELFKSTYAMSTEGPINLTNDALVFLKHWKDNRHNEVDFEKLSDECAEVLSIEKDLEKRDFRELLEIDYFRLIDQKIISDLVRVMDSGTEPNGNVCLWARQRRQSHWYKDYKHLYEAIDFAAQFTQVLTEVKLSMTSLVDGIRLYSRQWYRLDHLYRKFTYHVRKAGQASLMGKLTEKIENLYSNSYLIKVNDRFQTFIDGATLWDATPIVLQRDFFKHWVTPYLQNNNKICVIISDAMRYEVGNELVSLVRQEDRYTAELEPALSMLPSYTQLGMASLLPGKTLAIADNDTGSILVDGSSSQGLLNRSKILKKAIPQATMLKADDFMAMKGDECKAMVRDHSVIYIYHNRIDATGDKRESEERVFEAVEETLEDLIRLIKKLTSANVTNLLVTSDHGFIYQNRAIDGSDFTSHGAKGDQIHFRDRRFVFGKGLQETLSLRKFTSQQLGLLGDMEIQIPKSINRLRLKGSGSRFVHGGASLQEVVVPVIKINKTRHSDVTKVKVQIMRGTNSTITSGQLAVAMYQDSPVDEKTQARVLRAGIFTETGELISDSHELTFDLTSDNPRDREKQVRFVFTRKADEVNGQEVILKLEEKHRETSHYVEYRSQNYTMRRSFSSDFDF